ncbi:hypothetical protein CathTA2_0149 [Caldalkalibacillus thermarum TA2.A1]|uniref:Yip1 domain-containing protein n=1 Tax=Caldalkalibacillus thermarum (strain TA2.A1) TaxID=986075 RepID=F5L2Y8_CALTT|nr:hypothetical protein [Caldalkalibacillus thermarum]EGL84294.1 hypothetical protein CathTA2_0149 [Caldalkalibacillus thermarum TA2.A1]QZT34057.1 hypothetical protein HUR95_01050 [Caldalkalibacillus thermarum TA2.A1]
MKPGYEPQPERLPAEANGLHPEREGEEQAASFWAWLTVLYAPGDTMAHALSRFNLLLQWSVLALAAGVIGGLTAYAAYARGLLFEQWGEFLASGELALGSAFLPAFVLLSGLGQAAGMAVSVLVPTLILFSFLRLGGEMVSFDRVLGIMILSFTPVLIGQVVNLLLLDYGTLLVAKTSAAYALLGMVEHPFMLALLSSVDVFDLWRYALVGLGLSRVARIPLASGMGLAMGYWAVSVIVLSLLAFIGESRLW